jgi:hypothetical protein
MTTNKLSVITKLNVKKHFLGIPYKGIEDIVVPRKEAIDMFCSSLTNHLEPLIMFYPDIETFRPRFRKSLAYAFYEYADLSRDKELKMLIDYAYKLINDSELSVAYIGSGTWGEAKFPGGQLLKNVEEIKKSIELISQKEAIARISPILEKYIGLEDGGITLPQENEKGFFAICCI